MARGRLRTKIRGYLGWLPGKIDDCGDHEWYLSDKDMVTSSPYYDVYDLYKCYHCNQEERNYK
jgi:hypothetical protein